MGHHYIDRLFTIFVLTTLFSGCALYEIPIEIGENKDLSAIKNGYSKSDAIRILDKKLLLLFCTRYLGETDAYSVAAALMVLCDIEN